MGILRAFGDAVSGTIADQWKELIIADVFDEQMVVAPGIFKTTNRGRGTNTNGSEGVISNGSKIFVPENTAAFIFSQSGIENIITTPGGYEYQEGEASIFNGDGVKKSFFSQIGERIGYGGISATQKEIAFVNLREIRDIKFGTRGPQVYNDIFYGCDLEIYAYGSFSVRVTDAEKFIRNFVPPNVKYYSFGDRTVREQIVSDFLQSFTAALNALSDTYRISQIASQANALSVRISEDPLNAGSWKERFGFEIVKVSIENIEFSPDSRELVRQYNASRMSMTAYEDVSQRASNISAQQKMAEGVRDHGYGDMGGMIIGMNMAQGVSASTPSAPQPSMSVTDQIETLKKLKELLDMGILTPEEFEAKKKEIMGL